jgi:hypothetical protein
LAAYKRVMRRAHILLVLAAVAAAALAAAASATTPVPPVLVSVSTNGGFCPAKECQWWGKVTTTTVSGKDRKPRRLTVAEGEALVAATTAINPAKLPRFKGTCPIAYDGQERIYRFRGKPVLRSCTYDLSHVRAVLLTERLLESLKPR